MWVATGVGLVVGGQSWDKENRHPPPLLGDKSISWGEIA